MKKLILLFLVFFLPACTQSHQPVTSGPDPRVTPVEERKFEIVNLLDQEMEVEIVDSPERITLGLSYREEIGAPGMLFVMSSRGVYSFWMRGMRFNIDILWFDCGAEGLGSLDLSECDLVHVTSNAPAPPDPEDESNLPTYSPGQPVTHVLEVVAGDYEQFIGEIDI